MTSADLNTLRTNWLFDLGANTADALLALGNQRSFADGEVIYGMAEESDWIGGILAGHCRITMAMETPNGPMQMFFVGEYRTVEAPSRLVYTEAMADESGSVLAPEAMGMPPGAPMVTELVEVDAGTRMTMTHAGIPADSPGAQGWEMALDKLEARLAA